MPFMTSFERIARTEELLAGIELCLDIKFGAQGAKLMPEIRELQDLVLLKAVLNGIVTATSPGRLRRVWTRRRRPKEERQVRGSMEAVEGEQVFVRPEAPGQDTRVPSETAMTFSRGTRKALVPERGRAVGRRRRTTRRDPVWVTFLLDGDLWERFRALEGAGVIEDRTATVNGWLREKLDGLPGGQWRR